MHVYDCVCCVACLLHPAVLRHGHSWRSSRAAWINRSRPFWPRNRWRMAFVSRCTAALRMCGHLGMLSITVPLFFFAVWICRVLLCETVCLNICSVCVLYVYNMIYNLEIILCVHMYIHLNNHFYVQKALEVRGVSSSVFLINSYLRHVVREMNPGNRKRLLFEFHDFHVSTKKSTSWRKLLAFMCRGGWVLLSNIVQLD